MTAQRAALAAASGVVLIIAIIAVASLGLRDLSGSSTPDPSVAPIRTGIPVPAFPPFTIHQDQGVPEGTRSPTAHKAQSKLWFAHGAWWAVMTAPERPAITIHRLDPETNSWVDTGTLVDDRPSANADVKWDDPTLVIASAVDRSGESAAARIIRYHFDDETSRFVIDPDFPVRISEFGVEGIVVDRDSTGILWVAYTQEGQVYVNHSTVNDAVWAAPVALPWVESLATPDDIASVIAYGGDRIGVLWTNQRIGAILFISRRDGDPDDAWTEPEAAVEGQLLADDHLNAKATEDGTLLVAAKTSLDEPADANAESPLTLLLERPPAGGWLAHQFGRVRDHHTRPMILIDERARLVYMFATSPTLGGTVYAKWSRLDAIEFAPGLGEPVIVGDAGALIADPTSTKASIDGESGFVLLAFDKVNSRYVHASIGGRAGPGATPWPSGGTIPATVYFSDTFEPWAPGDVPTNGWELRDHLEGSLFVATDASHGRIAVLAATATSVDARLCKPFAVLDDRPVTVAISGRAEGVGIADLVGLTVRGSGGDLVSVRFGQGGRFSYYDGAEKVRSDVAYNAGAWYRIEATIDQAARRAAISVTDEGSGKTVLTATGLRWRSPDVTEPTSLCVQAPGGPIAPALAFDDALVRQP